MGKLACLRYVAAFAFALFANVLFAQDADNVQINDSILLQEVIVKADKKLVTFKPDRYVIDAKQLQAGKVNMFDLLRDVPGVIQERNNVSILGKGSVKVMINGRIKQASGDQLITLLKAYQASQVSKVEVIYNPDAKYDASGDYGILNFILEKPKTYFIGGSVSNGFTVSDYCTNESFLTLKYNKKIVTSYLSIGYDTEKEYGRSSEEYRYPDLSRYSNTESWNRKNQWSAQYGMDLQLDSLSICSLEASFTNNKGKDNSIDHLFTDHSLNPADNSMEISNSRQKQPARDWNASFYIDRQWSAKAQTSLIVDYYNRKQDRNYQFYTDLYSEEMDLLAPDYYHFLNQENRRLHGVSGALDTDLKLPSDYKLQFGFKGSFSQTNNENLYDYSNMDTQNDTFDYDEDCLAGYLTLTKSWGSHFNAHLGGRYEYTFTKGMSALEGETKDNYGNFFPNMLFSYRINDAHQLSATVRGGIVRPWMYSLNPFRLYTNAYNASEGTPTLRPLLFYNYVLAYRGQWEGLSYTLEARYRHQNDAYVDITRMDSQSHTSLSKWENAYKQNDWEAGYSLYYGALQWIKISMFGALTYWKQIPFEQFELPVKDGLSFTNIAQLSFTFDKKKHFTGSLFGSFQTSQDTPFEHLKASGFLRGGLNYTCLRDKLNLGVYMYNIISPSYSGTRFSDDGMTMHFNTSYRKSVYLSISYTFGKDIREKYKNHSDSDIKGRF